MKNFNLEANKQNTGMYDGLEPYIFISYSHRDSKKMAEVCRVLAKSGCRFWYDNGLHSGDDWNYVIAEHLQKSSLCLLLLSREAANSIYVKNEIIFAQNHRIPLNVLSLEKFELPIDVEIMISGIHRDEMNGEYEPKLLESLPGEVFDSATKQQDGPHGNIEHPLFQIHEELSDRQGTISCLGRHRNLAYQVLVQIDYITNISMDLLIGNARTAATLSHPIFPKIYDVVIKNGKMYTFQEYRGEVFLDNYLETHKLQESRIIEWISDIIDAVDFLFSYGYSFRDFSRGNLVVTQNNKLAFTRLQNPHYGFIKLQPENRQYYFEKEAEEIAVLLYQLCTRRIPILPFDIVSSEELSKAFIDKVNLILQKSTKEQHRIKYGSFKEIKKDLNLRRIGIGDAWFLKKRKVKLKQYESIKEKNLMSVFTGDKVEDSTESLEEKFGFESTVSLMEDSKVAGFGMPDISQYQDISTKPMIRIKFCSTGQVMEFYKNEIMIGRNSNCDMIVNQPSLSRHHAVIRLESYDKYSIEDLRSTNGTYVASSDKRIPPMKHISIHKGEIVQLGKIKLELC